jgi:hypothetical protein
LLFTVTSTNGLKLVCNVNIVYGDLKSENSQDYAQKPQRNCTFMNSASGYIFTLQYERGGVEGDGRCQDSQVQLGIRAIEGSHGTERLDVVVLARIQNKKSRTQMRNPDAELGRGERGRGENNAKLNNSSTDQHFAPDFTRR